MSYDNDLQSILFNNRTRIPNDEILMGQVNTICTVLLALTGLISRVSDLEQAVDSLTQVNIVDYPVRVLDTDFVISSTNNVAVSYTVQLGVTASTLGTVNNSAIVKLIINGIDTNTAQNGLQSTLILGVSLVHTHQCTLSAVVPVGAIVNLATTLIGTGTASLVSSQEIIMGSSNG